MAYHQTLKAASLLPPERSCFFATVPSLESFDNVTIHIYGQSQDTRVQTIRRLDGRAEDKVHACKTGGMSASPEGSLGKVASGQASTAKLTI
jgi:hypothetical protein